MSDNASAVDLAWARVEAASHPELQLFDELRSIAKSGDHLAQAELFERAVWRLKFTSANPFLAMLDAYQFLNRPDAILFVASFALQFDEDINVVAVTYRRIFQAFVDMARPRQALDVFLRHVVLYPETPLAPGWQAVSIAHDAGVTLPPKIQPCYDEMAPAGSDRIPVIAAECVPAFTFPLYGTSSMPSFLKRLGEPSTRLKIDVCKLPNARLLTLSGATAVLDEKGTLAHSLSPAEYPALVEDKVARLATAGSVEVIEADNVILLADRFVYANLCHFLLDHVTRLHLYEAAGIDIQHAVIVGPQRKEAFQDDILQHLGVGSYVDVLGVRDIRAQTLYVSTSCRQLHHAAHYGARWAVDYLRSRFKSPTDAAPTKLYLSRRHASGRRISNEADVEELLHEWGFTTVLPEQSSFMSQVETFSAATHIVAPHGAGLTNALFAKPGSKVLEIFHPMYGTTAYGALAREAGWCYSAMIGRDARSGIEYDAAAGQERIAIFGIHDIHVDLDVLQRWLESTAASQRCR